MDDLITIKTKGMPTRTRSYATRDGKAYYRSTGRYNEFTRDAENQFNNGSSSLRQKKLAMSGSNTGAAISTNKARKALGL